MGNDDPWPWWQEDAQHLGVPMAWTHRGMVLGWGQGRGWGWEWGWRWEWGQGQGTMSVGPQQCWELASIQALPPARQVRCHPLCRARSIQTPWGHPCRPLGRGGGGPPALPGPDTALPGAPLGAGQGESCSSGRGEHIPAAAPSAPPDTGGRQASAFHFPIFLH